MTRIATFPNMLAFASLACLAADDAAAGGAPAAPSPGLTEFEFPNLTGKRTFDVALVPPAVRMDFLKSGVRAYIANRLNGVHTRHQKDELVAAWNAYDEAVKADPLQSVVPQPTSPRPADPDYEDAYTRAIKDLTEGNVRRQAAEPKARKAKDPLVSVVSDVVAREVYQSRHAADPKYTFLKAKAEVGDGIAYLNRMIDAKVEAGADRAQLETLRDTKYVNPAKAMLGITTDKKTKDLPSIL